MSDPTQLGSDAPPSPGGSESPVRRVAKLVLRPYEDCHKPRSRLAILSTLWFVSIVLVLVGMSGGGGHAAAGVVAMFAVLCVLGESFLIRFHDKLEITASDVFYAVAFVSLPFESAAQVLVISVLWASLMTSKSVLSIITVGGSVMFPATVGLWSAHVLTEAAALAPATEAVVGVLAVFAGMRLSEIVMFTMLDVAAEWRDSTWPMRFRAALESIRWSSENMPLETLAMAPMSIVGVAAMELSPWLVMLLAFPYYVSWESSRRAKRIAEAERAAQVDPLTGLLNRAGLFDAADEEMRFAQRYGHSLALIMGDLDNFKRVNDNLGHLAGDEVLRRASAAFNTVITSDKHRVGRYGGEEFAAFIVAQSHDGVLALAEKLRAEVEQRTSEFGTSISLGVAYFAEGDRIESLVDRADKALYQAKGEGKNCVREAPGDRERSASPQADAAA